MTVPSNIDQFQATLESGGESQGIYPITQDLLNNPEAKSSLVGYYNNFFEDTLVISGQNYEIWSLNDVVLNDIYKNNLRMFNKYYILEKKKTISLPPQENILQFPFENDLIQDIPTKYLNREISNYEILISVEEL